jgi:hypothetical protein
VQVSGARLRANLELVREAGSILGVQIKSESWDSFMGQPLLEYLDVGPEFRGRLEVAF